MTPVKANLYISYAEEDRPQLDKLLRWLYPMRDEVNIWYNDPPPRPAPLPLPWQIMLFWYSPPDPRPAYEKVLQARRERAHLYLFLTSYHSLSDSRIEDEITLAVNRRIEGDELNPLIYPIILSPSRWKEESRLAQYTPLASGEPLAGAGVEEARYLEVTDQISKIVQLLQPHLNEEKYYQIRPAKADHPVAATQKNASPYLGDSPELLDFQMPAVSYPSEWSGWVILSVLILCLASVLRPEVPASPSLRYQNARPDNDYGPAYHRRLPLMPPQDTAIVFPPANY